MNPNFKTHGTLYKPSTIGRFAREENPMKKCHVHAPSIHDGEWVLVCVIPFGHNFECTM